MRSNLMLASLAVATLTMSAPVAAQEESWTDRISMKGDLRLRYETIDEDGEATRDRMRYRVRLGVTGEVSDNVKLVIGLASGADNPVSRNQTLGDGFSTKDFGLELAYVDWKISDELSFYGGKMKNPIFKAGGVPLIWDGDLNPEGLAVKFRSGGFFGTAGGFSVEERRAANDSLLYVLQAGYKLGLGDAGSLTAGAGYFAYTDTIGNAPFFFNSGRGNTLDAEGNYVFEYKNTEAFAQYDSSIGDWPVQVYAHYTQNNEVSREDTGYAFGAKVGSGKQPGEMQFSWTFQDIEADSVIASFNDSDYGGGGTDADGHILKAKYVYSEKIQFGGTLFVNKVDRFQGIEHDYSRLQLDVVFKFD